MHDGQALPRKSCHLLQVVVLAMGSLDAAALSCHDMQSGTSLSDGPRWEADDVHKGQPGLCLCSGTGEHGQVTG